MSLMQCPCGTAVPGAVPEPGWRCFGGSAYWFTDTSLLLRLRFGVPLFRDDVFVSVQTTIWLDV